MATTKKTPAEKRQAPVQSPTPPDRADVAPATPENAPKESAVSSLESAIKKEGYEAETWYDEGANLVYARAHNDKGHNRLLSMTPEELEDDQLKKEFVIRVTSEQV